MAIVEPAIRTIEVSAPGGMATQIVIGAESIDSGSATSSPAIFACDGSRTWKGMCQAELRSGIPPDLLDKLLNVGVRVLGCSMAGQTEAQQLAKAWYMLVQGPAEPGSVKSPMTLTVLQKWLGCMRIQISATTLNADAKGIDCMLTGPRATAWGTQTIAAPLELEFEAKRVIKQNESALIAASQERRDGETHNQRDSDSVPIAPAVPKPHIVLESMGIEANQAVNSEEHAFERIQREAVARRQQSRERERAIKPTMFRASSITAGDRAHHLIGNPMPSHVTGTSRVCGGKNAKEEEDDDNEDEESSHIATLRRNLLRPRSSGTLGSSAIAPFTSMVPTSQGYTQTSRYVSQQEGMRRAMKNCGASQSARADKKAQAQSHAQAQARENSRSRLRDLVAPSVHQNTDANGTRDGEHGASSRSEAEAEAEAEVYGEPAAEGGRFQVLHLGPLLSADTIVSGSRGSAAHEMPSRLLNSSHGSRGDASAGDATSVTALNSMWTAVAARHEGLGLDHTREMQLRVIARVSNSSPPSPIPSWSDAAAVAAGNTIDVLVGRCILRPDSGAYVMRRIFAAEMMTRKLLQRRITLDAILIERMQETMKQLQQANAEREGDWESRLSSKIVGPVLAVLNTKKSKIRELSARVRELEIDLKQAVAANETAATPGSSSVGDSMKSSGSLPSRKGKDSSSSCEAAAHVSENQRPSAPRNSSGEDSTGSGQVEHDEGSDSSGEDDEDDEEAEMDSTSDEDGGRNSSDEEEGGHNTNGEVLQGQEDKAQDRKTRSDAGAGRPASVHAGGPQLAKQKPRLRALGRSLTRQQAVDSDATDNEDDNEVEGASSRVGSKRSRGGGVATAGPSLKRARGDGGVAQNDLGGGGLGLFGSGFGGSASDSDDDIVLAFGKPAGKPHAGDEVKGSPRLTRTKGAASRRR